MFCSNCSKALSANLNYCSSCGTRVEAEKPVVLRTGTPLLGVGAIFIGLVGLIGFFPLLSELLHSGIEPGGLVVILAGYLFTVLVMFTVLLWQSRKGTTEVKQKTGSRLEASPAAFRGVTTAQLNKGNFQPASVTDHTTRTLNDEPLRRN